MAEHKKNNLKFFFLLVIAVIIIHIIVIKVFVIGNSDEGNTPIDIPKDLSVEPEL